jgi:ABC-type branched-subunit amino acid transport system permease subunit
VAFPIAIVAAGAGAEIAGFLAGLPSLRLRSLYLALSTIATYYIVMFLADRYQAHTVGSLGFVLPPLFGGYSIIWQERYGAPLAVRSWAA